MTGYASPTMPENDKAAVLEEVRRATRELESVLDDFSDRLRRLRQRNRQVEEEISGFEEHLDRLRAHILDVSESADQ